MLTNDPLSLNVRNASAGSKPSAAMNEPDMHSFVINVCAEDGCNSGVTKLWPTQVFGGGN